MTGDSDSPVRSYYLSTANFFLMKVSNIVVLSKGRSGKPCELGPFLAVVMSEEQT